MRAWALLGFLGALSACGGAAPGAKGPSSTSGDLDGLAKELEDAERTLGAELGPKRPEPQPAATPGEDKESKPEAKPAEPQAGETPSPRQAAPCETACKALASMKRSQERICELAGDSHPRCEWAKQRVADASERVEQAGCSCSPS